MSPSLTSSGFSGSGGDCKSAETSSILSSNSYASSSYNPYGGGSGQGLPGAKGGGGHHLYHHHHGFHHQFYASDSNNNNPGLRSAEGSVKSGGRPAVRPLMQIQPRLPGGVGANGATAASLAGGGGGAGGAGGAGAGSSSGSASGSTGMLDKFHSSSLSKKGPVAVSGHQSLHHKGHVREGSTEGKLHQAQRILTQCEVCQVSVNSSQQLHAHLAGAFDKA